jgi:TnpA family transposase
MTGLATLAALPPRAPRDGWDWFLYAVTAAAAITAVILFWLRALDVRRRPETRFYWRFSPDGDRNLIYVLVAEATNMGLSAMAESCGVPYEVLAWTAEWYVRPETLEAANTAVVNYHHRLPLTQAFGPGTLSSSDGQRFPTKGRSITARALSRYFARGQGVSAYTHVSDQHSTFDTKVIVAAAPESHYVLDGILGNATDLPIVEHATDTHGATLANFALFDLVGKQLSPRIRDLGKITLYRTGPRASVTSRYPHAGPLLHRRLNTELLSACLDDLLRVAASVKYGPATAALVVGKLCSSKRQQNVLTAAIKEYGALRRTIFAARSLVDETYRRRIARQLNKGENLHALRRELAYAGEGALRRHYHEQQTEQMWCLTLATNAIVTWTTEYYGLAIAALRRTGRAVNEEVLAHLWPSHHENVHFYGTHTVDVDRELAKLDADGTGRCAPRHPRPRPPRPRSTSTSKRTATSSPVDSCVVATLDEERRNR